jgi:hypothetical protein
LSDALQSNGATLKDDTGQLVQLLLPPPFAVVSEDVP